MKLNELTVNGLPIDAASAQELIDDMWTAGLRPSARPAPSDSAARAAHLADMRAIAFSQLKITPPNDRPISA